MTPTAFVTGATGYTGRAVVRILCQRDVNTVAHIRPGSSRRDTYTEYFSELGADIDCTPWEAGAMTETVARISPDIVFFLVGTTRARDKKSDDDAGYEAVDYGLLQLLVDACTAAGDASPRFIYLSAMGVKKGALTAYYRARYRAEEAVKDSGLPYVIARPAMITGSDRLESRPTETLGAFFTDAASTALRVVGARRLADRYRSIDANELATSLIDLALDDEATNQIVESEDLKQASRPT